MPLRSSLNVFKVPVILTLSPGFNWSTKSSSKTINICLGSVPPDKFSNGSCILAVWVSMYFDSSCSNLNDLPPHSLHKEGSIILLSERCSTSCSLIHPLHSKTPISILGLISSVFLTIPSAATNVPMYLLNSVFKGIILERFSKRILISASFTKGSIFFIALLDASITSSGFSINKSAKSGSNISKSL